MQVDIKTNTTRSIIRNEPVADYGIFNLTTFKNVIYDVTNVVIVAIKRLKLII